jgi:hypothetical protein
MVQYYLIVNVLNLLLMVEVMVVVVVVVLHQNVDDNPNEIEVFPLIYPNFKYKQKLKLINFVLFFLPIINLIPVLMLMIQFQFQSHSI